MFTIFIRCYNGYFHNILSLSFSLLLRKEQPPEVVDFPVWGYGPGRWKVYVKPGRVCRTVAGLFTSFTRGVCRIMGSKRNPDGYH